jgi:predicted transcriptional regulator
METVKREVKRGRKARNTPLMRLIIDYDLVVLIRKMAKHGKYMTVEEVESMANVTQQQTYKWLYRLRDCGLVHISDRETLNIPGPAKSYYKAIVPKVVLFLRLYHILVNLEGMTDAEAEDYKYILHSKL